ncbi:hypothetical protein, partial [Enterobacter hormaechei]
MIGRPPIYTVSNLGRKRQFFLRYICCGGAPGAERFFGGVALGGCFVGGGDYFNYGLIGYEKSAGKCVKFSGVGVKINLFG